MKKVHSISMAAAVFTLAVGLFAAPTVFAVAERGCYDGETRCTGSSGFSGTCGYNVSENACTCAGTYPFIGGTWEYGSYACQEPGGGGA
jgi:hypothetical protein